MPAKLQEQCSPAVAEVILGRLSERICVALIERRAITFELSSSNPAAFSKAFKRWTGHSPQQFRQLQGLENAGKPSILNG